MTNRSLNFHEVPFIGQFRSNWTFLTSISKQNSAWLFTLIEWRMWDRREPRSLYSTLFLSMWKYFNSYCNLRARSVVHLRHTIIIIMIGYIFPCGNSVEPLYDSYTIMVPHRAHKNNDNCESWACHWIHRSTDWLLRHFDGNFHPSAEMLESPGTRLACLAY